MRRPICYLLFFLGIVQLPISAQSSATSERMLYSPVGIKTNLLYDAALVPNIGIEFPLDRQWSVGGNWMYAWWSNKSKHRYWRIYGGELFCRHYFGSLAKREALSGHHIELYGQLLTYDFEWDKTGYLSPFSYGAGVAYGYSIPLNRAFNLDLTVGAGYLGGEYYTYTPQGGCYKWESTRMRNWVGITKAEVSLVWLIDWDCETRK